MPLSPMLPFAVASLLPAAALATGCVLGGPAVWIGVLLMTVVTFLADKWQVEHAPSAATGHRLSEAIGAVHFGLLGLAVWSVAHKDLTPVEIIGLITGLGLWFGQVSNSNAHELIHRRTRPARRLGVAVYASLLFGHHASAHPLVHHVHAATPRDPSSAPLGVGFWRFAPKAWRGGWRDGLAAERKRRNGARPWRTPYFFYGLGAVATLGAAAALGGARGVAALLVIAAYAQVQLLLSDYVQHYGLRRRMLADGRYEPLGPTHAWNAAQPASAAMMLNAPRHSDHHMRPGQPFPGLALDAAAMPTLPHSLPVMACVALIPPLWRRVMDPRVALWVDRSDAHDAPACPRAHGVPRAALAAVRRGGPMAPDLPEWDHVEPPLDPAEPLRPTAGGRANERRRI